MACPHMSPSPVPRPARPPLSWWTRGGCWPLRASGSSFEGDIEECGGLEIGELRRGQTTLFPWPGEPVLAPGPGSRHPVTTVRGVGADPLSAGENRVELLTPKT